MIEKEITYTDYNGNTRKEKFYFNLSKAEVAEMELEEEGGLSNLINSIINSDNKPKIISIFKKLILKSYGEKSADGKAFIKINDEGIPLSRKFSQTEAYSELFMELGSDADKAAEFIKGITPVVPNPEDHKK